MCAIVHVAASIITALLSKSLLWQVMEQCREIYATRQKTSGEEVTIQVKAKNAVKEWSAFHVALVAAKRRPTSALYRQ